MAKMLNLDDLMEKEPIKVVLNGVTHVMKELNVALYVDVMKKMEALEATKSTADELELSFDIISKMVPTLSARMTRRSAPASPRPRQTLSPC